MMIMINPRPLEDLFKPFELHFVGVQDLLDAIGISLKDFIKLDIESECSKSLNESCINTNCHYNFITWHGDDLYKEAFKENLEKKS